MKSTKVQTLGAVTLHATTPCIVYCPALSCIVVGSVHVLPRLLMHVQLYWWGSM